ncbi:DedA family protein [Methylocella sp.]|jgi:membrane protein DedA with SNARE-associated domain|uniref:DedA family protein n=1 Tax=Methylocella sp. TaxID=1978226 RepID=UPI003C253351
MFIVDQIPALISHYGYAAIFCVVAIESAGIPFPGETTLLSAAIFAGHSHSLGHDSLNIFGVVTAAAAGAIVGDNIGFWVGRTLGFRLLARYGHVIHLDEGRLKLGQYLFLKRGGAVVFFGRFVAVLRAFAAFLAGANRMAPWRFFAFNAAGGIVWASLFGTLGFVFGAEAHRIAGPIGIIGVAAALAIFAFGWRFYKRNEIRLIAEAEAALPGPLTEPA